LQRNSGDGSGISSNVVAAGIGNCDKTPTTKATDDAPRCNRQSKRRRLSFPLLDIKREYENVLFVAGAMRIRFFGEQLRALLGRASAEATQLLTIRPDRGRLLRCQSTSSIEA